MTTEQNKLITFYALLIISVLFNLLPIAQLATIGIIIFFVCFIGLYIVRGKAKKASLTYNHTSFMIKSIWISSLFLFLGSITAGALGDHTLVEGMVDDMMAGVTMDESQMNAVMIEYTKQNLTLFLVSLLPGVIYLLYRLIKGLKVTISNSSINNPGSWF